MRYLSLNSFEHSSYAIMRTAQEIQKCMYGWLKKVVTDNCTLYIDTVCCCRNGRDEFVK